MRKHFSKSLLAYTLLLSVLLGQFEMHFSQKYTISEVFSINELIESILPQTLQTNTNDDSALLSKSTKSHQFPVQHDSSYFELEEETEENNSDKKKLLQGPFIASLKTQLSNSWNSHELSITNASIASYKKQPLYLLLAVFRL